MSKFLLLFLFHYAAFSDEPIIVTADRIKSSSEESPNDIRHFSKEEIQKASTLVDLLRGESDLHFVQSGNPGSNASLFLRGTDSSHTLVVIDGIVMNDPSNPNRQFDIGRLGLNNIEKIEILKGSQGLLYGSNAIGGVIVITSKKAVHEKTSGSSFLNYGTYNTLNAGANVQKKNSNTSYNVSVDHYKTDGFSAANENVNSNADKDGIERSTLAGSFGQKFGENELTLNYRYLHDRNDLDKGGGPGNDDPNDFQTSEEQYAKVSFKTEWDSGETEVFFTHSKHHRTLKEIPDAQSSTNKSDTVQGVMNSVILNHTLYTTENLTQNFNVDYVKEEDKNNNQNENISAFFYNRIEFNPNTINLGLRIDRNRIFGDHLTYKTAFAHRFDQFTLKTSYSTGFRAPSLNQLFDPSYGSKNLKPETSQSGELGVDIPIADKNNYTATFFYTVLKDRLSYHPVTFVNQNRGQAKILGLENTFHFLLSSFKNYLSATWLSARDTTTREKLARRPSFNAKAGSEFKYDNHTLISEYSYIGKRNDVDNLGNTVKISSHYIFNIDYFYSFSESLLANVKIKNLLDKNYEEIFGYGTGGRVVEIGLKTFF